MRVGTTIAYSAESVLKAKLFKPFHVPFRHRRFIILEIAMGKSENVDYSKNSQSVYKQLVSLYLITTRQWSVQSVSSKRQVIDPKERSCSPKYVSITENS